MLRMPRSCQTLKTFTFNLKVKATEQDLFWVWDETFADDGTTLYGNAGGAFTAFKSANDGASAATLVDIRANIVHAVATGAQYSDVAERYAADKSLSLIHI